jgi:hypothetical protein
MEAICSCEKSGSLRNTLCYKPDDGTFYSHGREIIKANKIMFYIQQFFEPEWLSRYSDWIRSGQPRDRCSSLSGVKNFLFSTSCTSALWPTQPPIQWVAGALSQGVKRPGCETDYSPPASAKVKKMWNYTSAPPYAFMA